MKKVAIDFFKEIKYLSKLKGKGELLSYVVSNANLEKNNYESNIFLYDLKTNVQRQLTSSNSDLNYFWLNSDEIVFKSDREKNDKSKEEKTIYYKINVNGGEATKFIELPYNIKELIYIDENRYLFTASYDRELDNVRELESHNKKDYIEELEKNDDYDVVEEIPFWSNGGSYTKGSRTALYFYYEKSGEVERITSNKFDVEYFKYEEEFTNIYVIGQEFIGKGKLVNKLFKIESGEKELVDISPLNEYSYKKIIQINEKELIISGTDFKKYGLNENDKFILLNLQNKKVKNLTEEFDDSTSSAVGSDLRYGNISSPYFKDDTGIYFKILNNYTNDVMRLTYSGDLEVVSEINACIDELLYFNNEFYYIGMKKDMPQEIYKLNGNKKITNLNDTVSEYSVSTSEHMSFINRDNIDLDGFVMKPVNFDKNKKYPMILNIHGGPKTAYGDILYHEMQYWANEGYVVAYCNPRGSDGKGNEFSDIRGVYGDIDYNDIMDFVDEVLKTNSFIDENRLGVTGGSYGGFMTNWIIGHTNKFKVAASQRSISNWISFFGTSDIGYYFASDQVAATPWENHELMWNQSPLKYANKVVTPTLFIHSQNDYRCWTPEAYQMFTALKYFGVDSRLVLFKDENHELSRSGKPRHRIKRLKEITEWMDKYLK